MNKKQLYVAPAIEVSEYTMQRLILAASGDVTPGGDSGNSGSSVPGSNNQQQSSSMNDHETGLAKQMTTVFAND